MATAIKKTADAHGIYQYVESIDLAHYPAVDWEHNPDVSGVSGVNRNYWKYNGTNVVVEMTAKEKQDVDTALSEDLGMMDARMFRKTETFTAGESRTITLPDNMVSAIAHVFDPSRLDLINETLLSAAGSGPVGWDPGNVSTGEANINNGVYTDLVYNNSAAGNTTGIIIGIDMLTPTTINAMKRWDYSTSYYDTEWEFIGTDDATAATYTVIFSETQTAPYLDPDPFFRAFDPVTFRYYGWRCVTSFNATYTISREIELYTGTLQTVEKELALNTDYEVSKLSPTEMLITNMRAETLDLKVLVVGE